MTADKGSAVPPKAVIFDIGRVIVRLNPKRALEALAAKRLGTDGADASAKSYAEKIWTADDLWAAILGDPRWNDWQEGRITPREWHEHLMRGLHLSLNFEEFCAAWNSTLDPEAILSEQLFAQLGARCRLGLLSNTDPIHVEFLERHFDFFRHFPARTYSCSVGASKPSPAIYQAALRAVGVDAAEALYIDDIAEFAEAARQLGLDAIRFEDPTQLARELSLRGLLSNQ